MVDLLTEQLRLRIVDIQLVSGLVNVFHKRAATTSEPPPPLPIPPPGKILGPLATKQLHFYMKTN
jgi:hypothetical protein